MPKLHLDSKTAGRMGVRLDAGQTNYLNTQLTSVRKKAYEAKYPELQARKMLKVDHSIHPGAEAFSYSTYETAGHSAIGGGYAGEGPRVMSRSKEVLQGIIPLRISYGYSIQELENAKMAGGRKLRPSKSVLARKVLETDLDTLMLMGSSADKMGGLFTQQSAASTVYTPAAGAAGSVLWDDPANVKTPHEILNDLYGMLDAVSAGTNYLVNPDSLVLPEKMHALVYRTKVSINSNISILQEFLNGQTKIRKVFSSGHLMNVGGSAPWTGRRAAAFDSTSISAVIPREFTQLPVEPRDYELVTNCHARFGGLENLQPKAIVYMDGI